MAQLLHAFDGLHWGSFWAAFVQIVLIDVTLASDNAIAVGMAASGLPQKQRHLAIVLGLSGAVVLLCGMAFFAIKWLPTKPRQAVVVLALQIGAALAAIFPVWWLHW